MNDTDKGPAFARFYLAQDDYRNALREVRDAERAFNADPTDDNHEAKVEANAAAVYFAAKMAAASVAAGIPHPYP